MSFDGLPKLTETGVRALANLPNLTVVSFTCCRKLTDGAFDALASARNAPLTIVQVNANSQFTVDRLRQMAKECEMLEDPSSFWSIGSRTWFQRMRALRRSFHSGDRGSVG